MASTSFAFGWIAVMMMMGGGGAPTGLPLSLPPLPQDPVMSRIAPEECLWYLSLSGMAKPDAKSGNQTEQLLAESELQRLFVEVHEKIVAAIRKNAPSNPGDQLIATDGPMLIKTLLTRPLALYISKVNPTIAKGPKIEGGAILSTGDETAAVSESLARLETNFLGKAMMGENGKWHRLPTPPDAPKVEWGFRGNYLILGIGDGSADAIAARGKATSIVPAWLTDVKKQLPVERVSAVHYLNIKRALEIALPLAPDPKVATAVDALGLKGLQYYAAVSGMDAEGCVEKSLLATAGKPTGIFAAIQGKPLTAADLAPIPQNANLAMVARIDANKLFHDVMDIVGQIEPAARQDFERQMSMAEPQFGKLPDAVLTPLGDTWCVFNSPSEGGLLFSGVTAVVQVRDRQKLQATHDRLVAMARSMTPPTPPGARPQRGATVKEMEFNKHKIFFMNFIGEESPVAPAWCITDKELVVALYPQSIKSYLSRPAGSPSLAKVPAVAKALKDEHLMALTYQDSENVFRTVYPLLQVAAQMGVSQLQREGVDLDISMLPSADSIGKHLKPSITTISQHADGLRVISQTTVPLNFSMTWLLGAGMYGVRTSAMPAMPAFGPGAARESQSMNNMRQLTLCMHISESQNGKLPAAYSSKDGKPLLSWRVHVLPYIEQEALYREFHLDEPWDSEHNKRLIAKMPTVYSTPGVTALGKTCYVVPRGEHTMFNGDKAISLDDVKDGLSNTVMILEVDANKAVVWTQPDDWQLDEKHPLAGLGQLRDGLFLAAFADGSVHKIGAGLDPKTAMALFTRDGGETIDHSLLDGSGARTEVHVDADRDVTPEPPFNPGVQPVAPPHASSPPRPGSAPPLPPTAAPRPVPIPAPAPPVAPPLPVKR